MINLGFAVDSNYLEHFYLTDKLSNSQAFQVMQQFKAKGLISKDVTCQLLERLSAKLYSYHQEDLIGCDLL